MMKSIVKEKLVSFKTLEQIVFGLKNEILNSTVQADSGVYFCIVDIYSFIQKWYCYLSF